MNSKIKKTLKWVCIASLIAAALFWALGAMGGKGSEHRRIVEEYLSDISGLKAEVDQLNSLNFFPAIIIDFQYLRMVNESGEPQIFTKDVFMAVDFWDVAFRTGKFNALSMNEFHAKEGAILEEGIYLQSLSIEHESNDIAFLSGSGTIGEEEFTLKTPLLVFGNLPNAKYRFDAQFPVVLQMNSGQRSVFAYEDNTIILKPDAGRDE